jgi:pheromone alpha factor receptor
MDDISYFHTYMVRSGINKGAATGASIIMLIAILTLTKPEKRPTPLFVLNSLALLFNAIRMLLAAIYVAGPWQNLYALIAGVFTRITAIDKSNSIAAPVLTWLTLLCVIMSLWLQVGVATATMSKTYRWLVQALCVALGLVALGFQFAVMVVNCKNIMAFKSGNYPAFTNLLKQSTAATVIALATFTLIFVAKLGVAILHRRRLGLTKFGPMQVIFIMGIQTLIVPSTLALTPTSSRFET